MRLAVIADTHGNLLALEAVLADMRALAPDLVVNLGDLVSGAFDPAGSGAAQMALGCPTLAGNHERQVLGWEPGASDTYAAARLSNGQRDWIAGLPSSLSLEGGTIFACHGSPAGGDLEYLMEDVASGRPVLDSEAAIAPRLVGSEGAGLVLCGHSHVPRTARIGGVLLVNPGSVGMPAYVDKGEMPHAVENGTPHARYAVLTRAAAGWSGSFRMVEYDWDAAAAQARAAGFMASAGWIATGRV